MAAKKILLVEGTDDEHVVKNLCAHHGLQHIGEIERLDGIEQLIESFPVRLKESDMEAIGVVVDADTNIQTRWKSLRNCLLEAGYKTVPDTPAAKGTIVEPPRDTLLPRVGIWMMPDNQTNGTLEDFLRFLVPTPDPLLDHAQASIDTIPNGHRRFKPNDQLKALIHTWLAWQEEPGRPYGTAIKSRYLDADVPLATDFMNWLRQLFVYEHATEETN
jgi:hypothetical protein